MSGRVQIKIESAYSIKCPMNVPGNHINMEMQTSISIFFILLSEKSSSRFYRECVIVTEIADRISRFSSYSILVETVRPCLPC